MKKYIKVIIKPIGILSVINLIRFGHPSKGKFVIKYNNFTLAVKFYFFNGFLTNFPSYRLRTFYLQKILKITIGKKTAIHMGCFFAGSNIVIGSNNVIARKCYLDGRTGLIEIKNNVSIAPETTILSMTHLVNSPTFESKIGPIFIDDYVWIGVRAILMPGITVGKGSVIGAGSIVTKTVLPFDIVAGNPAKKIGERTKNLQYTLEYFPYFNTDI